jgi:hypothetical protein
VRNPHDCNYFPSVLRGVWLLVGLLLLTARAHALGLGTTPAQIHANFASVIREHLSSHVGAGALNRLSDQELRLLAESYALHTAGNTTDLTSIVEIYNPAELARMRTAARYAYLAYWEPSTDRKLAAEMRLSGVQGGDVATAMRETYLAFRVEGYPQRMAHHKNAMLWVAAAQTGWDYGKQIGGVAANYIADNYPDTWDAIGAVVVTAVQGSSGLRALPPVPPAEGPIYRGWGPQPDGSYQVPDCCASGQQPDGSYQVPDSGPMGGGGFGGQVNGGFGFDIGSPGGTGGGGKRKK